MHSLSLTYRKELKSDCQHELGYRWKFDFVNRRYRHGSISNGTPSSLGSALRLLVSNLREVSRLIDEGFDGH
jgi:hypothetical protein